jgi:hypothetical protein
MARVLYRPLSLLFSLLGGALGGVVAGAIFKRIWRLVAREEHAPKAADRRKGLARFSPRRPRCEQSSAIKGLLNRAGGRGLASLTGVWLRPRKS